MSAIDGLWGVTTNVGIMPAGGSKNGTLSVCVLSTTAAGLEGKGAEVYTTEATWPDAQGRTMEGLVYFLLHKHDAHVGRERAKQSELWPEP